MKIIILGIVQGLTEFLPISSSGHLVLIKTIMGVELPGIVLEVSLHFGTFLAIIIYFRKRLLNYFSKEKFPLIISGTIPIFIVGLFFKSIIEEMFTNYFLVLVMLFITGFILILSKKIRGVEILNIRSAFIIGIAQSLALIPGISRSGFTIAVALMLGISKEEAFEFSFILAIPALLGAFVIQLFDIVSAEINYIQITSGVITSFLSGIIALYLLYRIVKNQNLQYFTYYLWIVSLLGVFLFLNVQFPLL